MALYIVGTPIGNLEDITLRAIRILHEVDFILCEDTRVTKKLLQKYEINTPTISYHAHSKLTKVEKIIDLLLKGKNLALVSDAGTPAISDPGSQLVKRVREELSDVDIQIIPGPSAVAAALSASGFPADEFVFLGFLPHKKGRETKFKEITESKKTVVLYESPHRILKTIIRLSEILAEGRKVALFGEITKMHEKAFVGTPHEVLEKLSSDSKLTKGEFTLIVSPRQIKP